MTAARLVRRSACLATLCIALVTGSLFGLSAAPARAATAIDQCNGVGPGAAGATTGMTCSVTVDNTIDGPRTGSVVTVVRSCSLAPCAPGDGTFRTSSTDLVTSVSQCNDSDNDTGQTITCTVTVTTHIVATAGSSPAPTPATVNQCVGSATGGGATMTCNPSPANTTNADVTQCNGSGNGGGGTVRCDVTAGSVESPALPVTIRQCNGSGNAGGSTVHCTSSVRVEITEPTPPSSAATTTPAGGAATTAGGAAASTPAPSASATTARRSGSPARASARPVLAAPARSVPRGLAGPGGPVPGDASSNTQITRVPTGGVQAGGGSTAGLEHGRLLWAGGLLLVVSLVTGLVRRRPRTA